MKFRKVIAITYLIAPFATPLAIESTADGLEHLWKRNAWSVYLFEGGGCGISLGGYSDFGPRGRTQISATNIEVDSQGCSIFAFQNSDCKPPNFSLSDDGVCYNSGGLFRSFLVLC
jgi:hypothetical protein